METRIPPMPPVDVLTRSYSNARTGANVGETTLRRANVNLNQFGKLFSRAVDGQIYAQPLIVTDLTVNGETFPEAVIVATTRNIVYAFDVREPTRCDFLWRTKPGQLGQPAFHTDFERVEAFHTRDGAANTPAKQKTYRDFTEEIGIVSTPVI